MTSISKKDYDEILADQDGKCAICGIIYTRFVLDVDKVTNTPRGILCTECAKVIKYCHECLNTLMYASLYLEKWNEPNE